MPTKAVKHKALAFNTNIDEFDGKKRKRKKCVCVCMYIPDNMTRSYIFCWHQSTPQKKTCCESGDTFPHLWECGRHEAKSKEENLQIRFFPITPFCYCCRCRILVFFRIDFHFFFISPLLL
jgi:hypothetical protein